MAKEREHAEAILRMARKDFDALRGFIASDQPELFSDEVFGFHAQQAVEKTLKSWIAYIGKEYPKTHDLMSLIDVLADAGEDVQGLDELTELNPFAVQFRYEAFDEEDIPLDRPAILAEVERLLVQIDSLLTSPSSEDNPAVELHNASTVEPSSAPNDVPPSEEE